MVSCAFRAWVHVLVGETPISVSRQLMNWKFVTLLLTLRYLQVPPRQMLLGQAAGWVQDFCANFD